MSFDSPSDLLPPSPSLPRIPTGGHLPESVSVERELTSHLLILQLDISRIPSLPRLKLLCKLKTRSASISFLPFFSSVHRTSLLHADTMLSAPRSPALTLLLSPTSKLSKKPSLRTPPTTRSRLSRSSPQPRLRRTATPTGRSPLRPYLNRSSEELSRILLEERALLGWKETSSSM